jgi:hypothetical protein
MKTFSATWSDELGKAIIDASPRPGYTMSLVGEDQKPVIAVVNQGIDGYLEACFVPSRGDSYTFRLEEGVQGKISGARLECHISPQSLAVLVRRLMQSGDEIAEDLASSICQTIEIALV